MDGGLELRVVLYRFWIALTTALLVSSLGCAHGKLVVETRSPPGGYLIREVRLKRR